MSDEPQIGRSVELGRICVLPHPACIFVSLKHPWHDKRFTRNEEIQEAVQYQPMECCANRIRKLQERWDK